MRSVLLLDGGMGQALIHRSQRPVTPMWSADIMLNEPELVQTLHQEFISSGAQVITLNTYTATPQRLKRDASIDDLEPLHRAAMKAAKQAVRLAGKDDVRIAGCLPPLMASYHPESSPDMAESLATYRELVRLQAPASDLFICETMASITEAKAACSAAKETGKDVWVAFTVSDDAGSRLRSGELVTDALAQICPLQPDAILLNCSTPEAINVALPALTKTSIQFGIYANGFTSIESLYPGTTVESLSVRKDLDPEHYAQLALSWAQQGAAIIGGCCEITPQHIKAVDKILRLHGFRR